MNELLTAIKLTTDSTFNYHGKMNKKTYLEIDNKHLASLFQTLGTKSFIVHLAILSHWKDENGLPSAEELSNFTGLTLDEVTEATKRLLELKIGDTSFYNKSKLKEKNKQNYKLYR